MLISQLFISVEFWLFRQLLLFYRWAMPFEIHKNRGRNLNPRLVGLLARGVFRLYPPDSLLQYLYMENVSVELDDD